MKNRLQRYFIPLSGIAIVFSLQLSALAFSKPSSINEVDMNVQQMMMDPYIALPGLENTLCNNARMTTGAVISVLSSYVLADNHNVTWHFIKPYITGDNKDNHKESDYMGGKEYSWWVNNMSYDQMKMYSWAFLEEVKWDTYHRTDYYRSYPIAIRQVDDNYDMFIMCTIRATLTESLADIGTYWNVDQALTTPFLQESSDDIVVEATEVNDHLTDLEADCEKRHQTISKMFKTFNVKKGLESSCDPIEKSSTSTDAGNLVYEED